MANILSHIPLSSRFSKSINFSTSDLIILSNLKDKFTNFLDVKRTPNGVLYITKDTNAFMSAYVQQEIDLGTHIMFIAQLVEAEILSEKPTVTYDYYQKNIKPKPQTVEKKGWRCKICGYIYEGDELPADYVCPLCKRGADAFEEMK